MNEPIKPTGKCLTQGQGLSAMQTLQRFCAEQAFCENCIFHDKEMKKPYPCIFKREMIPVRWPEVKI